MQSITYNISSNVEKVIHNNSLTEIFDNGFIQKISLYFFNIQNIILSNKLYLSMVLVGAFLILTGLYISKYKKSFSKNEKKLRFISRVKCIEYIEFIINKLPLKILSSRLNEKISYFMLDNIVQRDIVAILTVVLTVAGILLFLLLNLNLSFWYTRLITLVLCLMLPYYIFTLIVDYMRYSVRLKIPVLIDNFRSSFMMHYRIKPALQECGKNTAKSLGRIILRASDSSDLNESLCTIRDKVNDTWFNIFILLILNYRENGGELTAQLYKLSTNITRYNNIEKKKNKRLIWYEVFVILTSIFSLPAIIFINKMILGISAGAYYGTSEAFTRIVLFSLLALIIVQTLRKM